MISALSCICRAIFFTGSLLTLVAIGLGQTRNTIEIRQPGRSDLVCVNGFFWKEGSNQPRLLDPRDHSLRELNLPTGDRLEMASLSTWVNQANESQLVGRWMRRSSQANDSICQEFGLARYSYPSGRVLDQIPTSIVPISPPCWYPGTESRVLFVAGDGQLYHLSFEDSLTKNRGIGSRQPIPLRWGIEQPGNYSVLIHDVCWPGATQWNQRLLVSLSIKQRHGDRWTYSNSQIWWLGLSEDGLSIVESGPVLGLNSLEQPIDFRRPALGESTHGQLSLAFLSRADDSKKFAVHLVPLENDANSGDLRANLKRARVIDEECVLLAPVFSEDGKSLSYLIEDSRSGAKLRHQSLDKTPDTTFAWASLPHLP